MKTIVFSIIFCGAGYIAGWLTNQKVTSESSEFLNEANNFKREVLNLQNQALQKVDTIFWDNDLYDADGSDTMADYLELRKQIDNLYNQEI